MAFVDFCNLTTVIGYGKDTNIYAISEMKTGRLTPWTRTLVYFFSLRLQKGNIFISYEVFSTGTIL